MNTPLIAKSDEIYAAARQDFATFAELIFEVATGHTNFAPNWHIELICFELEKVVTGETRRLIINLPPRHLKSFCASVAFPLWLLGRNPSAKIMCISYGDSLVQEFGRQRMSVIESDIYRSIFPGVRLARNGRSLERLGTTKQGYVQGFSMGGPVTGKGCDVMIIDDPMKSDESLSELARNRTFETFRTTLYSRFDDRRRGAIVLVMQRLHEEDLTGQVQRLCDWRLLSIPAVSTKPEAYQFKNQVWRRAKNTLIQPERYGRQELADDRKVLGHYAFEAQYQQAPLPVEGNLIKLNWFGRYAHRPDREDFPLVVLSVDPASSANPEADYSVITVWGVMDDRFYLLDLLRDHFEFPQLKRKVIATAQRWHADRVLIELAGVGIALFQQCRAEGQVRPFGIKPKGDKQLRLAAVSPIIESGSVFIPNNAPWLTEFIREILAFPSWSKDDQVDSLSQFLKWADRARLIQRRHRRRIPAVAPAAPAVPFDEQSGGRARLYSRIGALSSGDDFP